MRAKRQGFTLVEMMVSTALVIFVMVVLTESFVAALNSMRQLKTIGELQERLRVATSVLRKDLAADHFDGLRRLSDANFWTDGPPREGYFRVWQGVRPVGTPLVDGIHYVNEGVDADGIPSFRAVDHVLQFTVRKRGNKPGEYVSAGLPPPTGAGISPLSTEVNGGASRFQAQNTYATQWYEVSYFLRATQETANGTPLYALYRRQALVVPSPVIPTVNLLPPTTPPTPPGNINWGQNYQRVPVAQAANYSEYSVQPNLGGPNFLYFNSPESLTVPQHRFGMNNTEIGGWPALRVSALDPSINPNDPQTWTLPTMAETNPALAGSDLLLSNVVSFQVQLLTSNASGADFQDVPATTNNTGFQARITNNGAYSAYVFDTWTNRKDEWSTQVNDNWDYSQWNQRSAWGVPWIPRVYAIKITLRIWDLKSEKTRQITIIQDL